MQWASHCSFQVDARPLPESCNLSAICERKEALSACLLHSFSAQRLCSSLYVLLESKEMSFTLLLLGGRTSFWSHYEYQYPHNHNDKQSTIFRTKCVFIAYARLSGIKLQGQHVNIDNASLPTWFLIVVSIAAFLQCTCKYA